MKGQSLRKQEMYKKAASTCSAYTILSNFTIIATIYSDNNVMYLFQKTEDVAEHVAMDIDTNYNVHSKFHTVRLAISVVTDGIY